MIRIIQFVATVAMALALVACDGNDNNNREEVEELKAALEVAEEKVMELEAGKGRAMALETALAEAQEKVMTLETALAEAGTSEAGLETALEAAREKVMALETALVEALAGTETLGIYDVGAMFTYVASDGREYSEEVVSTETMYRGRRVVEMTTDYVKEGDPCSGLDVKYVDWETGSFVACLLDGEVLWEAIPHLAERRFPLLAGDMWSVDADYVDHVNDASGSFTSAWEVEACDVEITVPAGTFSTCRVSATNWDEAHWYAMEDGLRVRVSVGELVTELSDYDLTPDDASVTVQPKIIDVAQYLTGPVEQGEASGLIAAVIDEQGVVRGVGAAGARRQGMPEKLAVDDVFHIASAGKSMTATMLAVLIDEGIFPSDWDTTIADVFPELTDVIDPAYHDITLFQLLRMTGRVVSDGDVDWSADNPYQNEPDIVASRYALVRDLLQLPPTGPPGGWVYSSIGYVVAGAMAEKLTGESWEDLMETHLLDPLGMTTASFGFDWPDTPGVAEWGHLLDEGAWEPVALTLTHLPWVELIGPAGGVHLSVEDWAKFIALWFPGQTPAILDRAALDELLVTVWDFYGAGWIVNEGDTSFWYAEGEWTGGPSIFHYGAGGDKAGFSAVVRILPDRGIAYVAFANASSESYLDDTEEDESAGQFAIDVFALLDTVIANLHDDPDVQDIAVEF